MAGCVAVSAGLGLASCHRAFGCAGNEQCGVDGVSGFCEASGYCSFPDDDCPSGRRYGEHAAESLVDICVLPGESSSSSSGGAPESSEVGTGSTGGTTDTGSGTTESACVLEDSPPIVVQQDGAVIENLRITVESGDGIFVDNATDVTLRNIEISLVGSGNGIHALAAPDLRIENAAIVSSAAEPSSDDAGIWTEESERVVVENVRIERTAWGILLENSDEAQLSFIEGHDMRGRDFVRFRLSGGGVLSDFSSENDMDASIAYPENIVGVESSLNVTIRDGLLAGLNSVSGHGVNFTGTDADGEVVDAAGLVLGVDAVNMTNGAFGAWTANDVTFRRTRARDNFCDDANGIFQGEPASGGTTWAHASGATGLQILDSSYFNLCSTNVYWPADEWDAAELTEEEFEARAPVRASLCWE